MDIEQVKAFRCVLPASRIAMTLAEFFHPYPWEIRNTIFLKAWICALNTSRLWCEAPGASEDTDRPVVGHMTDSDQLWPFLA